MARRVKIGPAFSESINEQRFGKVRSSKNFVPTGLSYVAPFFFLIVFFSIIFIRLFYLQVIRGSYYKGLSDQNRTRTESIAAPRGIIFDRLGRPLIANSPAFKTIDKTLPAGKQVRLLSRDEALPLIAKGVTVESETVRDYLNKQAFAHVVGYIGQISEEEIILPEFNDYSPSDFVGKSGLEKQYETLLHGQNGKRLFEVDAGGKKIRELGTQSALAGQNLHTTLDRDIGNSVAKAFEKVERGAAIVSDPRDGGILAIYSSPSYDPNIFTHNDKYRPEGKYLSVEEVLTDQDLRPLLNRATSGVYPPGSTFKLVAAAGSLESRAISTQTEIDDPGILKVGTFSFGNWYFLQYGRTDGVINVVGAIKRSNDIFFYKAAESLGVDKLSSWAKNFGLGRSLDIDLPEEAGGTVPTRDWKQDVIGEPWYLGDTYNYGIGQGYLLTTPLQVNSFTEVFANGGTLYRPHLLNKESKIIKDDFIKKENIDLVRLGMRESCETGGVAWPFFDFKVNNSKLKIDNKNYIKDASAGASMVRVKVACKTGTAESGGDNDPHAWITVFAPFEKPEIVVTVLVENGGEGSSVAGPIAHDILRDYFEKKK